MTRAKWWAFLVAIVASLGAIAPLRGADWFVAPVLPGGDGSRAKPFYDPWRALDVAAPGDTIHLAAGTYLGRHERSYWQVDRPRLTLLGGYDTQFTRRDPWKQPTVLVYNGSYEGVGEVSLLSGMEDHDGLVLDGLVFDGSGRNRYDDKPPRGLAGGLQTVGPLLSLSGDNITIRNCVFLNSRSGAVEAHVEGLVFENNLLVNCIGSPMLSLRETPSTATKKPATVKSSTFAFSFDEGDPPLGKGGERGIGVRVGGAATIESNTFIGCGNTAISLYVQQERVSVDRNQFWINLRADVSLRESSKESVIGDKNLEELEDLGLKSCKDNRVQDAGLSGLPSGWVDAVTHHLIANYAKPPKEALNQVRKSFGLPEDSAGGGKEDTVVFAPYLEPAAACGLVTAGPAGAHPAPQQVRIAGSGAAARPVAPYTPITWKQLLAGDAKLNGQRVELPVAVGNERNGFMIKGVSQDKYVGFDVMYPEPDATTTFHVYTPRFGPVHREWAAAQKSNNARDAEDFYLMRGIYRTTGASLQKATVEVESLTPTATPAKPVTARPSGRAWFVRAGSSGGDGSKEKPFRDPFQALEKAEGGDSIHVAGGDYFGKLKSAQWKISIRNLSLFGGYDATFAARDPWKNPTRLVQSAETAPEDRKKHGGKFLEATENCQGLVLDGFVFDGSTVNGYFDKAAGGGLDLINSPLSPMVQLMGAGMALRNCTFVNAFGSAVDLSGQDGLFENNVVCNTVGSGVNISGDGVGPWIVRGNSFLFAGDPSSRAGTGLSAAGTLLSLRGRCSARIEKNLFAFADNVAIRSTLPASKLVLEGNVFGANLFCHFTDTNRIWLYDSSWARRAADSGLLSVKGNAFGKPLSPRLDPAFADVVLPRLFELKGKYDPAGWSAIASAVGATARPPAEPATAPATAPAPVEKPKEPSLDDLVKELERIKSDSAKPTAAAAPKGPPFYPAYDAAKALDLATPDATAGAKRASQSVALGADKAAGASRNYESISFEKVAAGRDAWSGHAVQFDARPPRSVGGGATPPADLSPDVYLAFRMVPPDDSIPRVTITLFVRRDSAASKAMDRARTTDVLRCRGTAKVVPNFPGLVVVADSVGPAEGAN